MLEQILYLGPEGSYTDLAKEKFVEYYNSKAEFISKASIIEIIRYLNNNNNLKDNIGAVIPIENSIEGVVRESLDNLHSLAVNDIRITAETTLSIEHSLIGHGTKKDILSVISHPQALAQCREYLYRNFNSINQKAVFSTSNAVKSIINAGIEAAAIGNKYCAQLYKVPIIEEKINDEDNNTTRFILLSKIKPTKKNSNKISITFSTENKSGALKNILDILNEHKLNMSYIDSRPSRKQLGEYVFFIDFEGYINDEKVSIALSEIKNKTKMFEILSEGAELII